MRRRDVEVTAIDIKDYKRRRRSMDMTWITYRTFMRYFYIRALTGA